MCGVRRCKGKKIDARRRPGSRSRFVLGLALGDLPRLQIGVTNVCGEVAAAHNMCGGGFRICAAHDIEFVAAGIEVPAHLDEIGKAVDMV